LPPVEFEQRWDALQVANANRSRWNPVQLRALIPAFIDSGATAYKTFGTNASGE
jgi:hypothetical protein